MNSQPARAAIAVLLGLASGVTLMGTASAQSNNPSTTAANGPASPWTQSTNSAATQADAWFDNYKFRDGETLDRLKIHYSTLGKPHRNAKGEIDNAVT